jgi:serine/threonine-protein phosphatase 2A regulatory subunit B
MTGSYDNYFHIYDTIQELPDVTLQADKSAFKAKRVGSTMNRGGRNGGPHMGNRPDAINVDAIDFNKKIMHASWHPREDTIAVAATNNLFIFT